VIIHTKQKSAVMLAIDYRKSLFQLRQRSGFILP